MPEDDIIRLSDLEAIADKINQLPKPYDIQKHQLDLTDRERRLVNAIATVSRVSLFNDFKRLNDKIKNHHHVVLSVEDGIEFRENGNRMDKPRLSGAGMGTTHREYSV